MPIPIPRLDDRRYQDLVEDMLRRIPAHTPEWTNPRPGDPGRTLIELFAWLADTILYRANLIPERQRLAFLSLLGMPLRPAQPAKGLIALELDTQASTAVQLLPQAEVNGPPRFETTAEVTVFPCTGDCYYKRKLASKERTDMEGLLGGLRDLYGLDGETTPYVTTRLFAEGAEDVDLITDSIDQALWIALMANKGVTLAGAREQLEGKLLNVGFAPAISLPLPLEQSGLTPRVPFVVEISRIARGKTDYLPLDVILDTTQGLRRQGIMRLALPAKDKMEAPANDVRQDLMAGVGENPPRIDDPEKKNSVVAWLRLRPLIELQHLRAAWAGIHAVEIDQSETVRAKVVGVSDGTAGQQMRLPATSVDEATLDLQVEEAGIGWRTWRRVSDLGAAGRDDAVYTLDAEAGVVRFGDNVRGRIPAADFRVRVNTMRAGGGSAGNLPPRSLDAITPMNVSGGPVNVKLNVVQAVPTSGGEDAETLAQAERRLPSFLRHQNRAVTELDIRQLAVETPGQRVGRVELMPMFVPQQRRFQVPGVVTVMALPAKGGFMNPNPRADRPFLEAIDGYLRPRKPMATELYVIGCEYEPLGVAAGVTIRDGFGHDLTLQQIRDVLRAHLWPLAPGGPNGTGWPLGRTVKPLELEVAVARVPAVETVQGVRVFRELNKNWQQVSELRLEPWQLPELLAVVVTGDGTVPNDLSSLPNPFEGGRTFAVPVVPEVC